MARAKRKLAAFAQLDDEDDVDRDTWCTPWWIADALGRVWLDPCWNERSHVDAEHVFDFERLAEDALFLARRVPVDPGGIVFINPPYSRGLVGAFAMAFAHCERTCYLVRFDTSTMWFAELYKRAELILIPHIRVNFETPPGTKASNNNPYPHALMFRRASDASDELRAMCFAMTTTHAVAA